MPEDPLGHGPDPVLLGRGLTPGRARGPVLLLERSLSFWGGVDPASGRIIDVRHPQVGRVVTGTVLALPHGRGSSSSSTVLAEAIRLGTGPVAILMSSADPILVLGALVADELYGRRCPIVEVGPEIADRLRTGDVVDVDADAGGEARIGFGT